MCHNMAKVYYAQRLPQDTIDKIKAEAKRSGLSESKVLEQAIGSYKWYPTNDSSKEMEAVVKTKPVVKGNLKISGGSMLARRGAPILKPGRKTL